MERLKDWGPGYRFFECEGCEHNWKSKSRDCTSPSIESCPSCFDVSSPTHYEPHYEWPTDKFGNLLKEEEYDETL